LKKNLSIFCKKIYQVFEKHFVSSLKNILSVHWKTFY
jgi:hypothetical protein